MVFSLIEIIKLVFLNISLLALAIVTHELGHFIFCLLFKIRLKKVILGSGKLLFEVGIFEVRLLPTGGRNVPYTYNIELAKWKWKPYNS